VVVVELSEVPPESDERDACLNGVWGLNPRCARNEEWQ
jgi:hypothetical protein